jgi:hypothetical protein
MWRHAADIAFDEGRLWEVSAVSSCGLGLEVEAERDVHTGRTHSSACAAATAEEVSHSDTRGIVRHPL